MLKLNALIIIYVFMTTFILLLTKVQHEKKRLVFIVNTCILIWETIPFLISIPWRFLQFIFDISPLLFLPILHQETELWAKVFRSNRYDQKFIEVESKYFPKVMRLHMENQANSYWFSEYLHLCYLSFYLLIYGVPLYFYFKHEFFLFYQILFGVLFLLLSCYMTHGIVPVCGPRNIYEKISDSRSHGYFFRLTHKILEVGSTNGTAFPSGHTGVACIILLLTYYIHTPLFYYLLPIGIGLILSTIYGRFHYVTDVIAGLIYAVIAFMITIHLYGPATL